MPPPSAAGDPAPAGPGRPPGPWWASAFTATYLDRYPLRDDAEARRHGPTILRRLALPPAAAVLDLGCGAGRYARVLAAAGLRVTGVDASAPLLDEARRRAAGLPGAPTYVRADMRRLPFGRQFDAVVSLFTSFGYFDDPADDARVLAEVARVLRPGGRLLLDFLHADVVRRTLVPAGVEVRGGLRVDVARTVDDGAPGGPVVRKVARAVDVASGRELGVTEERVRLYAPARLDAMLRAAGLEPEEPALGGLDGAPFGPDAPRFVRVARRGGGAPR